MGSRQVDQSMGMYCMCMYIIDLGSPEADPEISVHRQVGNTSVRMKTCETEREEHSRRIIRQLPIEGRWHLISLGALEDSKTSNSK